MKLNTKRIFRYFWGHVKKYKVLTAFMVISLSIGTSLALLTPYFYKLFFDALVESSGADRLIHIIVIIFAINAIYWVFRRFDHFAAVYFQTRIMVNIANECFEYLHKHSYNFFNNNFTGSLVKKINRLVRAFEGIADVIHWDLIPLILRIGIIFAVLFWLQPVIGLIMLIWTSVFMIFNYFFVRYKWKYDLASAKCDTKVTAALADTITNNINIKLFTGLINEAIRFKKVTEDWLKKTRFTWNLSGIVDAVQWLFMIILEFLIFYFAIKFWQKGYLTIGDFVWIQAYLLQLFVKLRDFDRIIRRSYEHLANAEEMIVVLHKKHDIRDIRGASNLSITRGKIEFKKVFFTYNKGANVIRNLSFKIKSGEKVALIGPSGGGKSTIIKLLFRLFDIQKGKILIDNQNISEATQDSLRQQITMVPQDPILFHRTLMENIRYGRHGAGNKEVIAAAKLANCHDFIMSFPKKYNTYVGERGVKLSGGERQRVAIARAILSNVPILILDEATSSLDSHSEALIQDALKNLTKNKTTLVIAHRLSTIMKMDRIIVLQDGKIVEEGVHANLVNQQTSLYKKLWDLQAGGYLKE